jgi:GH18 family chitinase
MTYDLHGSWESVTGENSPLYAGPADRTAYQQNLNVVSTGIVLYLLRIQSIHIRLMTYRI